jgi:hypothetical protein
VSAAVAFLTKIVARNWHDTRTEIMNHAILERISGLFTDDSFELLPISRLYRSCSTRPTRVINQRGNIHLLQAVHTHQGVLTLQYLSRSFDNRLDAGNDMLCEVADKRTGGTIIIRH